MTRERIFIYSKSCQRKNKARRIFNLYNRQKQTMFDWTSKNKCCSWKNIWFLWKFLSQLKQFSRNLLINTFYEEPLSLSAQFLLQRSTNRFKLKFIYHFSLDSKRMLTVNPWHTWRVRAARTAFLIKFYLHNV